MRALGREVTSDERGAADGAAAGRTGMRAARRRPVGARKKEEVRRTKGKGREEGGGRSGGEARNG